MQIMSKTIAWWLKIFLLQTFAIQLICSPYKLKKNPDHFKVGTPQWKRRVAFIFLNHKVLLLLMNFREWFRSNFLLKIFAWKIIQQIRNDWVNISGLCITNTIQECLKSKSVQGFAHYFVAMHTSIIMLSSHYTFNLPLSNYIRFDKYILKTRQVDYYRNTGTLIM